MEVTRNAGPFRQPLVEASVERACNLAHARLVKCPDRKGANQQTGREKPYCLISGPSGFLAQ